MNRYLVAVTASLLLVVSARADVSRIERQALKEQAKAAHSSVRGRAGHLASRQAPGKPNRATGSIQLTDASGMEYFINTDITFSTSSSASGAESEASYTAAVAATTSAGGTVASTLNDAFDGYSAICASTTGATGPCATGDASYTIFNLNGPATTECGGRQVVYPVQTIGSLTIQRKLFVPTNDEFSRWLEIVTNNGGAAASVNLITSNNLGSDANTVVVTTSDGDATPEIGDSWITTFQNYSGSTSSDPRLGHVFFGPGGAIGLATAPSFSDGDDNPFWVYTLNLAPGETQIVMHFVTAQPSKAAAAAQAAAIADLQGAALDCLTDDERGDVVNFSTGAPQPGPPAVPAASTLGLLALGLLLAGSAFVVLRRRG